MRTALEDELCFPQLGNTSCRKSQHSHPIATSMLLTVIALITVTLNLLVIISIAHFKQLQTTTNLLLLSLATSDTFVGFLMLFQISLLGGCWFLGDLMCIVYFIGDHFVTSASIGSMVLISIDRYMAICDPLGYTIKVTKSRVNIAVFICWFESFFLNCLFAINQLKQPARFKKCVGNCEVVVPYTVGMTDLLISFIGPIAVIVVLYMNVFAAAASQSRAMRSHVRSTTLRIAIIKSSELKAARTLGVVVVVFITCIMPYFCIVITGQDVVLNASYAAFIICLFYFNSCLNPLIYAILYPWFRRSIKIIVTLQILKPDSSQINIMINM
ncbi:trace amine-associated receptor 13c-like [Stigmatopora argus]